mmetsp:Transcript_10233/g.10200  ORF Transcript_10233/g.10200 Transcript_10233/m.10200 type:complete len:112 (+) Transcript_10233:1095-1430(+)
MNNALWNVFITLTTVGFGDFYPKSTFGRIVGVIVCSWGVFVVSFFVVTLNNMLTFNANEEKSYNILQRLRFKDDLKIKATKVLTSAFKKKNLERKEPQDVEKNLKAFRNFR